jgi:hypothetical protein
MAEQTDSGYEKNYQGLIKYLENHDFKANNLRLGLKDAEGGAIASFLGRDYRITKEGVEPLDGQGAHPNFRSILIHYAVSPGTGGPGGEFLALSQLPGILRGRREPGKDILNNKIVRLFGETGHEGFKKAALKLSGEYLGDHPSGGKIWLFKVFPKVHMQAVFYEADEEYPVDVKILFDSNAPAYLEFECLAFLNGCLVDALAYAHDKDGVL